MAAALDKWITKRIWESAGLPVAPYRGLTEEGWRQEPGRVLRELEALGLPVFVKPANLGSSIGIEKVRVREDLPAALDRALAATAGWWWSRACRHGNWKWRCWAGTTRW